MCGSIFLPFDSLLLVCLDAGLSFHSCTLIFDYELNYFFSNSPFKTFESSGYYNMSILIQVLLNINIFFLPEQ